MSELATKTHTRSATVQEVYLHIKLAIIFTSQQENFFDSRKLFLSTQEVDWKNKKNESVFSGRTNKKKLASTASKKAAVSCSQSAASKVECEAGGNNNRFPITMSLILGKKEEKHNLTTILKEVLAAVTEPALFFFLPGTSKII